MVVQPQGQPWTMVQHKVQASRPQPPQQQQRIQVQSQLKVPPLHQESKCGLKTSFGPQPKPKLLSSKSTPVENPINKPNLSTSPPNNRDLRESFIFAVPAKKAPTTSNTMVEWKNTFNVRPVLLSALKTRRHGLRQNGSGARPGPSPGAQVQGSQAVLRPTSGSGFGAARSLDLLRTNLQSAINRDIKQVLNKYLERFFQPAMENIRVNLGDDVVESALEEQVRAVLQRVLEEAKQMYSSRPGAALVVGGLPSGVAAPRRHRKRGKTLPTVVPVSAIQRSPGQVAQQPASTANVVRVNGNHLPISVPTPGTPATLQQMFKKRREMDAEAEARRKRARLSALNGGVPGLPPGGGGLGAAPGGAAPATPGPSPSPRLSPSPSPGVARAPLAASLGVAPLAGTLGPAGNAGSAGHVGQHVNYQSPKWDPARITPDTVFVMGARANKVLGYETSRGRLYTKHQDLFKYASDHEDKEWLARNQLIQPTGGKAFLCILQDIHELAVSQEYKNNPNVNLLELKGFRAPEFLLKKIRAYMRNLRTEPLDDLSGLLEMDLLQEDGVATIDDSSLMELALEYGVTLMSDDPAAPCSAASSPSSSTTVRSPPTTTLSTGSMLTTLPPSLEALAPPQTPSGAATSTRNAAAAAAPVAPSSLPSSPITAATTSIDRTTKALIRSQSLPTATSAASGAVSEATTGTAYTSEQNMMESLALEELELYIKSQSVPALHASLHASLHSQQREEELFAHIMRVSAADSASDSDAVALDASLDASLEANLDANLDLNLDVNLDVSGAEHTNLELAWDFLEAEATIGELNTPTHSPGGSAGPSHPPDDQGNFVADASSDDVPGGTPGAVAVTVAPLTAPSVSGTTTLPVLSATPDAGAAEASEAGAEAGAEAGETATATSLAMSHATLTALLAGNTLEGLEIPDGLL